MRILLLTTLPNKVFQALSVMPHVKLTVIDFSEDISKQTLCDKLVSILKHQSYDILITYRCPYIIPEDIFQKFELRLNIHPLPLPEYAGLNPWGAFFKSGCRHARTILHNLTAQPDAGEIIMEESYEFQTIQEARDIADATASQMLRKYLIYNKI